MPADRIFLFALLSLVPAPAGTGFDVVAVGAGGIDLSDVVRAEIAEATQPDQSDIDVERTGADD